MKYKLLAVDLDGTLLNDAKQISTENIEALREYRSRGGQVAICSGRTPLSTRWVSEALGFNEPIISLNGSVTTDTVGAIIEEHIFPEETVLSVLEHCRNHQVYAHVYTATQLLIPRAERWNHRWTEQNIPDLNVAGVTAARLEQFRKECKVEMVGDLIDYVAGQHPRLLKMALFSGERELLSFADELHQLLPNLEISSSHPSNLELSPAGVNKGAALMALADRLGISITETAAIGDNHNDVSMLQLAGLGIAMGNAPTEIMDIADAVTDTNVNHGVAHAINNLLLKD